MKTKNIKIKEKTVKKSSKRELKIKQKPIKAKSKKVIIEEEKPREESSNRKKIRSEINRILKNTYLPLYIVDTIIDKIENDKKLQTKLKNIINNALEEYQKNQNTNRHDTLCSLF